MRVNWPYSPKTRRFQHGFSLVELSVVVAILSVVATLGLEAAANFMNRSAINATRDKLVAIDDAIDRYYKIYGRLPCPALSTDALSSGSSTFGVENCGLGAFGTTSTGGGLRGGMVPFRALNLPMSAVIDGFGNRINYVVTKNLTVAGTGSSSFGNATDGIAGIEVRTGQLEEPCDSTAAHCQKIADPSSSTAPGAAYIAFSNGTDQKGGIPPRSAAVAIACANNSHVDAMNCQYGGANATSVPTIPTNVFYDNRYNAGLNASSYFDDVVIWRTKAQL